MFVVLQQPSKASRVGTSFLAYGRMSSDVEAVWGTLSGPGWFARQSRPTRTRPTSRPGEFSFALPFINLPFNERRFTLEIYSTTSPDVPIITVPRLKFVRGRLGLTILHPLENSEVDADFWASGTTGNLNDPIRCFKMDEHDGEIDHVDPESGFWSGYFSSVPEGTYTLTVSHADDCETGGGQGDSQSNITVNGID